MAGAIDVLNPDQPKRVVVLASNPAVSDQTGWPIGFWWAELTHPNWEFASTGTRSRRAEPRGLAVVVKRRRMEMRTKESLPASTELRAWYLRRLLRETRPGSPRRQGISAWRAAALDLDDAKLLGLRAPDADTSARRRPLDGHS